MTSLTQFFFAVFCIFLVLGADAAWNQRRGAGCREGATLPDENAAKICVALDVTNAISLAFFCIFCKFMALINGMNQQINAII